MLGIIVGLWDLFDFGISLKARWTATVIILFLAFSGIAFGVIKDKNSSAEITIAMLLVLIAAIAAWGFNFIGHLLIHLFLPNASDTDAIEQKQHTHN